MDAALQGATLYKPQKLKPPRNIIINLRDYRKIKVANDIRSSDQSFREGYARAMGDPCRALAVLGHHDARLHYLVCQLRAGCDIEKAIRLAEEAT